MRKPEGVFCSESCWNKNRQHKDRLKSIQAKDSKFEEMEQARRTRARVIYAVVAVILVSLAVMYVMQNPHSPLVEGIMKAFGPLLKKIGWK